MARILVIDDEQGVRLFLREILERDGHKVADAPDGKAGLRLFSKEPADLTIVDIFMPEKEGLETIRELRREYPGVKIIAISGGGQIGNFDFLHMAKRFGAICTIAKPLEKKEMLDAVHEVLEDKGVTH
ncbi:MAG: response regulator [Deltaproteobacteria bacterium]|nr:response regulator [Deltaproteobacteria bacterium]